MKHVVKGMEPPEVTAWKNSEANANRKPVYKDLNENENTKKLRRLLRESLVREQSWVCCYCGGEISLDASHIEHFLPKAHYPSLSLDYNNLHASCGGHKLEEEDKDKHCDHAKGDQPASCGQKTKNGDKKEKYLHCGQAKEDEQACISPLEPDCEQRFIYSHLNGLIFPTHTEDTQAKEMIKLLNLNANMLKPLRENILSAVVSKKFPVDYNDVDFFNEVSNAELEQLMRSYREKNEEGKLLSFGHVVARFIEQELTDRKDTP
jgi:uncharacterized protein (TIGR02646 family)